MGPNNLLRCYAKNLQEHIQKLLKWRVSPIFSRINLQGLFRRVQQHLHFLVELLKVKPYRKS